jgi:hypothetical protein
MKVLFDMVHPADVHFFRFAISNLVRKGDEVCVASRRKDITLELLDELDIENTSISDKVNGTTGLFIELLRRDYTLFGLARHFRPDIIVANNSPCGEHVAWLLGIPSIVFDDTEIHRFNQMLYYPLVTEVHSPVCYRTSFGRKHHFYPGYHSLAYLHPDHFHPDPEIVRKGGLNPEERPDEYNRIEARITELLSLDNVKSHHRTAWSRMMDDKINVSAYQTDQIYS